MQEFTYQLFWFIAFVTGFTAFLLLAGWIGERLQRHEYLQFRQYEATKHRWSVLVSNNEVRE